MKKIFTTILFIASFLFLKTNILTAQVNVQDSLALVALYNSTDGSHWTYHTNWLTTAPVSTWSGISLNQNRVSIINLKKHNLSGSIPPEIGNLTSLSFLYLNENNLSGSIPPELGNLKSSFLDLFLDHNQLSGSIPPELGNFIGSHIRLYLNDNQLSGTIPGTLLKLDRRALLYGKRLRLQRNKFTFSGMGRIVRTFHKVYYAPQANIPLYKNGDALFVSVGSIPYHNTYNWYKDGVLYKTKVGDSTLNPQTNGDYYVTVTNSVAKYLTLHSYTVYYAANDTTLQLHMQDSLALVALYNSTNGPNWLHHKNWLTAPLSSWYGITVINNRVSKITLEKNGLSGSIPSEVGNLTKLTYLNLSQNDINSIPVEIGNLTDLRYLSLNHNQLNGNIPVELSNLSKLNTLFLAFNSFSGNIPAQLGNLTNLTALALENNSLSGGIPPELGNLTNLTGLNLSHNQLSGSISQELGNLIKLTILDLSYDQLSGSIQSDIGNLTNLTYLRLNDNQLSGSIPPEMGNLTHLQYFYLNNNQLSGSIPAQFENILHVYTVDLSNNQLSDTIPISFVNPQYVYLENNKFTFESIEKLLSIPHYVDYSPEANIPVHINGNTLSVSAGGILSHNTYKWYRGGGLQAKNVGDSTFTPTVSGAYYVVVNNSVATQLTLYSDTVYYNADNNLIAAQASELNNENKLSSINVYPNPAKTNATLLFNAIGKYSITITDVSGKILQTKTGVAIKSSNIIQLDVSKYASGIYLITIIDEKNRKQTLRLSKE